MKDIPLDYAEDYENFDNQRKDTLMSINNQSIGIDTRLRGKKNSELDKLQNKR